jgi:TetR/AcrR family transcriptional regulator
LIKEDTTQNTEQRILDAAQEIFFREGYAGGKMQDIADAAGINKALLHYYFKSKEKLFEVIFKEAISRFIPKLHQVFETEAPFFEKLESFISIYMNFLISNPAIPMFVMSEINKDPDAFTMKIFGGKKSPFPTSLIFTAIQEEIDKGRIKSIPPPQLLINIISLCVFPFAGRPMLQRIIGISDTQFNKILEQRKEIIFSFIKDALRP